MTSFGWCPGDVILLFLLSNVGIYMYVKAGAPHRRGGGGSHSLLPLHRDGGQEEAGLHPGDSQGTLPIHSQEYRYVQNLIRRGQQPPPRRLSGDPIPIHSQEYRYVQPPSNLFALNYPIWASD